MQALMPLHACLNNSLKGHDSKEIDTTIIGVNLANVLKKRDIGMLAHDCIAKELAI